MTRRAGAQVSSRLGVGAKLISDERLALRAAQADEHAFAAIFERYGQSLYRFCASIVGDPEDAHDALQNTMVKVLQALPGEKRRIQLRPWLYRIAHNESVELLRRRRDTRPLDPETAARGGGLADTAEKRQRLRTLLRDLDELPERQRGALVMRELAGLEFAQIAAAFETSAAVVRQAVYEARQSLQRLEAGREMSCAEVTRRALRRRREDGAKARDPGAPTGLPTVPRVRRCDRVPARGLRRARTPASRRRRRHPPRRPRRRRLGIGGGRDRRHRRRDNRHGLGGRGWRRARRGGKSRRDLGPRQIRRHGCDRRDGRGDGGGPQRPGRRSPPGGRHRYPRREAPGRSSCYSRRRSRHRAARRRQRRA